MPSLPAPPKYAVLESTVLRRKTLGEVALQDHGATDKITALLPCAYKGSVVESLRRERGHVPSWRSRTANSRPTGE